MYIQLRLQLLFVGTHFFGEIIIAKSQICRNLQNARFSQVQLHKWKFAGFFKKTCQEWEHVNENMKLKNHVREWEHVNGNKVFKKTCLARNRNG